MPEKIRAKPKQPNVLVIMGDDVGSTSVRTTTESWVQDP
jgi:hypothetical protein